MRLVQFDLVPFQSCVHGIRISLANRGQIVPVPPVCSKPQESIGDFLGIVVAARNGTLR